MHEMIFVNGEAIRVVWQSAIHSQEISEILRQSFT
jgi:hypothetical protein